MSTPSSPDGAVDPLSRTGSEPPTALSFDATTQDEVGVASEEPADAGWGFMVTPYLFASGLSGTVRVASASSEVDADFEGLLDDLNFGAMLNFEAAPPDSSWKILADLIYTDLGDSGTAPGPAANPVSGAIDQFVGELSAAYGLLDHGQLELLGGLRYWYLSSELTVDGPSGLESVKGSKDWIDPLIGVRSRLPLGQRFDLLMRGDLGGFGVGSDFSYNLGAGVEWSASKVVQLVLGFRYLYVDYEDSDFEYDMAQSGPLLGLTIRF